MVEFNAPLFNWHNYLYRDIIKVVKESGMVDMNKMKVYHGSTKIINKPIYGYGKKYNDYGLGFYMTEDKEMAKEWSCEYNIDGFVNSY